MSIEKKDIFLGIDIGAGTLKIVLLAKEKNDTMRLLKAVCQDYEQSALELTLAEQLAKTAYFLKRFLQNEKSFRNVKVGISIGGQSAFVRLVKIPVVAPQKLRQIVLYEIQQQIPFPIKDVVWDFQIYGRDKKQLSILIAAVKKELINTILNISYECSIEVEFIDVSNLALYNCLQYFYKDLKETLIIDCGARTTNLIVASTGNIWTRSLPLGGEHINDELISTLKVERKQAEEIKKERGNVLMPGSLKSSFASENDYKIAEVITGAITDLTNEIVKTLKFNELKHVSDMKFRKVILCGGLSKIKNIDKFFENVFSFSVEKTDYFSLLKFDPKIDTQVNEFIGPAIGIALRGIGMVSLNVNLLPVEHIQYKQMKKKIPYILGSFLVIFMLLLGAFYFVFNDHNRLKAYQLELGQSVESLKESEKAIRKLDNDIDIYRKKIKTMEQALSAKHVLVFILEDIASVVPDKIWIKSLDFDRTNNSILFQGSTSDNLENIAELENKLENKAMIKKVKLETVGKLDDNIIGFSMRVALE